MIECVPVPVLVTRDMRVSMKELEGNDPGLEPSGYEEGRSENARQEQLEAFRSRVSNQFFGLEQVAHMMCLLRCAYRENCKPHFEQ